VYDVVTLLLVPSVTGKEKHNNTWTQEVQTKFDETVAKYTVKVWVSWTK
jgi:hypothetical protein